MRKSTRKILNRLFSKIEEIRLRNLNFIIISNNCWGFELYQNLHREYNTPFVGLFLYPECFLRLLENFDDFPNWDLSFTHHSVYMDSSPNYPVGLLPQGIEVHFLHYRSRHEAKEKWNRRVERFKMSLSNGSTMLLKFCDRSSAQTDHFIRFHKLSFGRKVSFGISGFESPNHIKTAFLKEKELDCVVDGLKLYKSRYKCFDFCLWAKSGHIKKTIFSRLQALILP